MIKTIKLYKIDACNNPASQLKKIKEELEELEIAYMNHKYRNGNIEEIINESFDLIESTFNLMRMYADNSLIEAGNNYLIDKLKIREYIANNYKIGNIIYKDCNWLFEYNQSNRYDILEHLCKQGKIKKIYKKICCKCDYCTGFYDNVSELDQFEYCDECDSEFARIVFEYRKN